MRSPLVLVLLGALTLGAFMRVGAADPLSSIGGPQSVYELLVLGLVLAVLSPFVASASTWSLASRSSVAIAFAYALWATFSLAWSIQPLLTFGKGIELLIALAICLLFVVAVKEAGLSHRLYELIAWAAFLVVIAFLIDNVFLYGTPLPINERDVRPRLSLGYTPPLESGDLAALGLLACVICGLRGPWKLLQITLFASVLLLTNSRAGIIGMVLALLVWTVTRTKSGSASPVRTLLLWAVLISAFAGAALIVLGNDSLLFMLPPDVLSLNGRVDLWQRVLDLAFADPLRTVGGYGYFASRFLLLDVYAWAGHSHQALLEVLLTTGAIGMVLAFAFIWSTSFIGLRNAAVLTIWTYVLVTSFDNPTLFAPTVPMVITMWTLTNAMTVPRPRAAGRSQPSAANIADSRTVRSAASFAPVRAGFLGQPSAREDELPEEPGASSVQ